MSRRTSPDPLSVKLGKRIRVIRKGMNISLEELVRRLQSTGETNAHSRCHLTELKLAAIEAGHIDVLLVDLLRIASALEVSPAYLMTLS